MPTKEFSEITTICINFGLILITTPIKFITWAWSKPLQLNRTTNRAWNKSYELRNAIIAYSKQFEKQATA